MTHGAVSSDRSSKSQARSYPDADKAKFNERLYEQAKKKLTRDKYVKTAKKQEVFLVKISNSLQVIITLAWSISIAVLVIICRQNVDSSGIQPVTKKLAMFDLILGAIIIPSDDTMRFGFYA